MGKRMLGNHLVAIDVGTTKICVLVARVDSHGKIDVIGMGQHPSKGLKKGVVVNVGETVESIKKAVSQAESIAGVPIERAAVGISGGHIRSFNSKGVVAVRNREVSQRDIDRVIESAKAIPIPEGREILHILPQYFRVDGQEYVQDSLGMHGVRLEAQVHIITGAVSSAQNIISSCQAAGVQVTDIVLEQIASADAVLTQTERDLGVGILDVGGGTSDFAIYKEGRIRHSKVLPIAGNHFTSDLAIGLGIPVHEAEKLKRSHGYACEELYLELDQDRIEVDLGYEGKKKLVDTYALFEILEPRAQEIIGMIADEINEFRLRTFMPSGVVLTGGGSLLGGMCLLVEEVFGTKARIGVPQTNTDVLKSPIYSTAYGLLVYAMKSRDCSLLTGASDALVTRIFKSMKSWIYDFL
ncbi:cell division protein FtsA [Candidatus Dependentiae bacterium]|nr:cell division protein FtsA [Candidatus Dependentiae bacterium]